MSILSGYFNGNKDGATGTYPWRPAQMIETGRYAGDRFGDRYLGHNIAGLAVDGRGEIIDFDFNHNDLYNSSAEHAEARLVRRLFGLTQIYDGWQTRDPGDLSGVPLSTALGGVTIYTTLESCAQCSGIMTLGNVKAVVYLQHDPGQYAIGNIMYNLSNPLDVTHPDAPPMPLTTTKFGAPEPIPADLFGFQPKLQLEAAYDTFSKGVAAKPFYTAPGRDPDAKPSITSFLCTDAAKSIFDGAVQSLRGLVLKYPDFRPASSFDETDPQAPLSNMEVLDQAERFLAYALNVARRGTPHH
jgi:tRNA(Arg) A34 adenosine deaminase TadA